MTANINRFLVSALPVLVLAIAGCGTTNIITTDPRARIMVDGRQVGRGQGEITQTGVPDSSTVAVVSEDGRRETVVIQRRFTGTTLVFGLFTYGICLLACWQYPDTVFVPLPGGAPSAYGQGAPAPYDPWMPPPASQPSSPRPPPPDSTEAVPVPTPGPASPPPLPPPRPVDLKGKKAASIAAPSAEVRSAPSKVAPVILVLPKGQVLLVDATSNAGWRFVPLKDGRAGYIEDAQIKTDSP